MLKIKIPVFNFSGSETRLAGKITFFSGRTGEVLSWSWVPDEKESYYSPVIYNMNDGTPVVLFGTGGLRVYSHQIKAREFAKKI